MFTFKSPVLVLYFQLFVHFSFSQISAFKVPAKFSDANTLYQYEKSNWDGSHRAEIFIYLGQDSTIEAFKWAPGDHVATLVKAWMDWRSFSIRKFENWKVENGKDDFLRGYLEVKDNNKLSFEFGEFEDTLTISALPWHSYDFDFAGLGYSWRALINKKKDFYFHIADAIFINDQPAFVNKGRVNVTYLGKEKIGNEDCLSYDINGEGLENKGGRIWIHPKTFMIRRYRVELPDEPGYDNVLMNLLEVKKMSLDEWKKFILDKLQ